MSTIKHWDKIRTIAELRQAIDEAYDLLPHVEYPTDGDAVYLNLNTEHGMSLRLVDHQLTDGSKVYDLIVKA